MLLILFYLLTSPEPPGPQSPNSISQYDKLLQRERAELDVLNRTRYGDFDPSQQKWLNISGLNEEDGLGWDRLGPVQQRATQQAKDVLGDVTGGLLDGTAEEAAVPVYRNISGYVQGEWVRSSLARIRHPSDVNTSRLDYPFPVAEYDRNLTGSSGPVRLHITELEGRMRTDQSKSVSEITARVVVGDDDSVGGNWWEFVLNGVHYPRIGGSILTTTSEK